MDYVSKIGFFFDIFSEIGHSKFLISCMMVEGNEGHHFSAVPYLGKILIRGLRGIKCQKLGFFDTFSETSHQKFLIFCMIIEHNRAHHVGMVP